MPRYDYPPQNVVQLGTQRTSQLRKDVRQTQDQLNTNPLWGAAGDGQESDFEAVQNALWYASDNDLGVLEIPPGNYIMDDQLEVPNNISFRGSHWGKTFLTWQQPLDPGKVALTWQQDSPGIWNSAPQIENIVLQGPGIGTVDSGPTHTMDGIKPYSNWSFRNVQANGFYSGLIITYDHQYFQDCRFSGNYINVEFEDDPGSKGDHTFIHCYLDGSNFASIAVFGNNTMDGVTIVSSHCGFGPYGMYHADARPGVVGAPPASGGMCNGCVFVDFAFEAIGNGWIMDESTGGANTFWGTKFVGCNGLWADEVVPGGWGGHFKINSRDSRYAVYFITAVETDFWNQVYPPVAGAGNDAAAYASRGVGQGLRVHQLNVDDTTVSQLSTPSNTRFFLLDCEARVCKAVGTISKGDVLQYSGGWDQVQRFAGSGFAGIAMNNAADGGGVIVAVSGEVNVNCVSSVSAARKYLRCDTTTNYKIVEAGSSNTTPNNLPVIGVSTSGGSFTEDGVTRVRAKIMGPVYVWSYVP